MTNSVRIYRADGSVEDLPDGLNTEAPSCPMRRFLLDFPVAASLRAANPKRFTAEGIVFSGGWVVMHLLGEQLNMAMYASVEEMLTVNGAAQIRWIDG